MLFSPFTLRTVRLRNRIGLAPMSQYSAREYRPTTWHFAHYVTRAQTTGVTIVEATAISRQGRGTPEDLGIWEDTQTGPLAALAEAIAEVGSVPALQLSHAGRKASRTSPVTGNRPIDLDDGGWIAAGPSGIPFAAGYQTPHSMTKRDVTEVIGHYRDAARRALTAGFQILEVHGGHGRLLHTFYSPLSNRRSDEYGGPWKNRIRLVTEVVSAIREVWPDRLPLALRLSCVDWTAGGWTIEDSIALADRVRDLGVDIIDCTSGGVCRETGVDAHPGYQVRFARQIREQARIATAAVGLIDSTDLAERIVRSDAADLVLVGRRMLLDPYFALRGDVGPPAIVPGQYQLGLKSLLTSPADEHVPEW